LTDRSRNVNLRPMLIGVFALGCLAVVVALWRETNDPLALGVGRLLSGSGNVLFLAGGGLALLAKAGATRCWREVWITVGTLAVVTLCVHLLKVLSSTDLLRPTGSPGGFPSGHASAAFALAFLLSRQTSRWSAVWYLVAIGIGGSRMIVEAHHAYQIVSGSALGFLLAVLVSGDHKALILGGLIHRVRLVLMWAVPCIGLMCTLHECENDLLIFGAGGVVFAAGVLLRVCVRLHRVTETGDARPLRANGLCTFPSAPLLAANTLICVGLTVTCEVVWLVPLTFVACMVALGTAEHEEKRNALVFHGSAHTRYTSEELRWYPRLDKLHSLGMGSWEVVSALKSEIPTIFLAALPIIKETVGPLV